ncbi:MAG: hypothetical protein N2513_03170 [Deltaproteobacteria bacterium]|nr:hypothetical protein [Deltaproteobacteria bacterium]
MLKLGLSIGFFFIITATQTVFINYFSFEFLKADFGIPFIVYHIFFGTLDSAFVVALIIGFLQEGFSTASSGTLVFSKISLLLFCFLMRHKFYIESQYTFAALCGASEFFESLLVIGLSLFTKADISNAVNVMFYVFPNSVFTATFSLPIYSILVKFEHKYGEKKWD